MIEAANDLLRKYKAPGGGANGSTIMKKGDAAALVRRRG
jgi:hypothetical protein